MKTIRLPIGFALFVISCAPIYVPNVANTPYLSEKNEIQAAIHLGTSGMDPQMAYAVTDHIGIMLNGSTIIRTISSSESES